MTRYRMGPSTFAAIASGAAMPAPITRKVPQKKLSPIPASGPIRAVFTDVMEAGSYSPSAELAYCSSMAQVMPMINGDTVVAQLKNSR